ncbi:hypothetical protein ACM1RC_10005 [Paenibacillus azoreducens]|uniref:hypothetical protein n=1 Tax=Paenibacillus azoreducens TaxID=116718 RepID=UPI0039F4B742
MNNHQIIAVWGSPGSGKTVTSIKLAREFASRQINVLVVLCDSVCPSIPTLLPGVHAKEQSLGRLLSLPSISQEQIFQHLVPCKAFSHLAFIGYVHGDNAFTYASYTKERALDFFTLSRHLADVVIVDCSSVLSADPLSVAALEVADQVLRMHECTLKSLSYFASHLPLLSDSRFHADRHLHLLSNVKAKQDSVQYSNVFGGIHHLLPFVSIVEQQAVSARLLDACEGKDARSYLSAIQKLAGRFMDYPSKADKEPFIQRLIQRLKGVRS